MGFGYLKSFLAEYFLGSRGLGTWALAFTFAATSASGRSFGGYPSLIYSYGWVLALWIASYMIFPLTTMGVLGKRLNEAAPMSIHLSVAKPEARCAAHPRRDGAEPHWQRRLLFHWNHPTVPNRAASTRRESRRRSV